MNKSWETPKDVTNKLREEIQNSIRSRSYNTKDSCFQGQRQNGVRRTNPNPRFNSKNEDEYSDTSNFSDTNSN